MTDDEKQLSLTMVKRMFNAMFAEIDSHISELHGEADAIEEDWRLRDELRAPAGKNGKHFDDGFKAGSIRASERIREALMWYKREINGQNASRPEDGE